MEYLEGLNDAQREAVINTEGPSLVIAGAGAGKTRVLTYRIANLLNKGVRSHTILALTFTNKAAREMKERINSVVGTEASRYLWMGTFHSIFARILRTDGERLGYQPNFTIYDSADSKQVIRQVIKEMNLDDKVYAPGQIASRISAAKNNLITAASYQASQQYSERDKMNKIPLMADIYRQYTTRCFRANAMDFDDLLLNTNILFRDFPDVLKKYQEKFSYILVDEYQDTNYSQYLIVKQLAAQHGNLCVVGDDAQSIYSFRGARIENIFDFRNDYPSFRIFKLEQNYRSTQTIVKAANSIIDKNEGQIQKTIYSHNEVGEKIRIFETLTDSEEGVRVASDIFETRNNDHVRWQDFAILYRTNAQSRIFEEMLRKKNIPYRVYGGLSFYERKEIRDILAYFRMIVNPSDEEAFRRSINFPKRGIGDTSIARMFELALINETSVWSIAGHIDSYRGQFNAGTCSRINSYVSLINQLSLRLPDVTAFTLASEVAGASGIMKEFREGKTVEDISRLENLEQLLNAIQEFTEAAETNGEPSTLDAYLATVSLLTDQDSDNPDENDRVTLMTVHSAKGLEFRYVYITGMEENLFPSLMSSGTAKELEEERRLFYVAVTRAMKQATLSYANNRYKWGNLEHTNPSRFLTEIDQQFVKEVAMPKRNLNPYGGYGNQRHFSRDGGGSYDSNGDRVIGSGYGDGKPGGENGSQGESKGWQNRPWHDRAGHEKPLPKFDTPKPPPGARPLGRRPVPDEGDSAGGGTGGGLFSGGGGATGSGAARGGSPSGGAAGNGAARGGSPAGGAAGSAAGSAGGYSGTDLEPGDRVHHERFGNGEVMAIEGNPPDTTAVVQFAGIGTKKLLLRFAKLTRL
jgi:DNA helicase II / ATP-dependent DNA helicase PcrA